MSSRRLRATTARSKTCSRPGISSSRAPRPVEASRYHGLTMRVAVVGATGAVGREITRILEERAFPVEEFVPLASERSAGRGVSFEGRDVPVRLLTHDELASVDLALASAGATVSKEFLWIASQAGVTCIDNSSAFRMDVDVPLS